MTDEEKNLIKAAAGELCKTADLAKGFHENAKWLAQHYRTLVAELEGEVRALKSDVEQRDKALSEKVEELFAADEKLKSEIYWRSVLFWLMALLAVILLIAGGLK